MKPKKKRLIPFLKSLLVLILLLALAALTLNVIMIREGKKKIVSPDALSFPDADCILVLGAGVRADKTPSHMLADRLTVAVDLYENGAAPKLLMSGDHGQEEYDEVNVMKGFAVDAGAPAEDVFMDHAGFSTYDSLIRARDVFGAKRIVIVTQEYHLYRALWLADALGIEAVGVPADLRTYIGQSVRETREIAARCKDFLFGLFEPGPAISGEPIDLTGSGSVTDDGKGNW